MNTIIKGGTLIDGEAYLADVHIEDDRIKAIGPDISVHGAKVIDARGLFVSPGFIDTHRHIDAAVLRAPGHGEVELHQGITSAICGNCGFSAFPRFEGEDDSLLEFLRPIIGPIRSPLSSVGEYLRAAEGSMPAINIGTMVGSGSVRVALNGFSGDMPEKALSRAEAAIASALDGGAFGLSMGLMYAPEMYYGAPALKRLVRAMGGRGVFAVHVRGEGKSLVASVREALALAKDAGVRAVISHFKTAGCPPMGEAYLSAKGLIDAARCAGQDVSADVYPYAAGSTSITTLLPPSMLSGGIDALTKRLSQESERAALRQALDNPSGEYDNLLPEIGFKSIRIASGALAGKTVEAASRERGVHGADIIADLITTERGETTIVNFIVAEENLHDALSIPHAAIVSDALYGAQMPHPRVYGAFPRMLRLAREQKRPLPGIIARMTRIPAERYGIRERGRLKPGYFADIAVFDPETVTDLATYESPRQLSIGIRHVLVNGQHTLVDGKYTGATRGRVLRRDQ